MKAIPCETGLQRRFLPPCCALPSRRPGPPHRRCRREPTRSLACGTSRLRRTTASAWLTETVSLPRMPPCMSSSLAARKWFSPTNRIGVPFNHGHALNGFRCRRGLPSQASPEGVVSESLLAAQPIVVRFQLPDSMWRRTKLPTLSGAKPCGSGVRRTVGIDQKHLAADLASALLRRCPGRLHDNLGLFPAVVTVAADRAAVDPVSAPYFARPGFKAPAACSAENRNADTGSTDGWWRFFE